MYNAKSVKKFFFIIALAVMTHGEQYTFQAFITFVLKLWYREL